MQQIQQYSKVNTNSSKHAKLPMQSDAFSVDRLEDIGGKESAKSLSTVISPGQWALLTIAVTNY